MDEKEGMRKKVRKGMKEGRGKRKERKEGFKSNLVVLEMCF